MLKGNLKCEDINKLMLGYINYEISKKDMANFAVHLRNCPNCMEKYTKIQRRKRELKKKLFEIEKQIKTKRDISIYMDNESDIDYKMLIESTLIWNIEYKKELEIQEKLRSYLLKAKNNYRKDVKTKNTFKIIAKLKKRKRFNQQLFQHVRRVFAKC